MSAPLRYIYFLFFILMSSFVNLNAQEIPYLERKITYACTAQTLAVVLKNLSDQTGVVFSYTQAFDDKRKVNCDYRHQPLRLVLSKLLVTSNCSYKEKDKYIIIKCDHKTAAAPAILKGYIYNGMDSTYISRASIYVKQTKHSSVSNDYGFFALSYSSKLPSIEVSVAKEEFKDTSLVIYHKNNQEVTIYLYPRFPKNDNKVEMKLAVEDHVNEQPDTLRLPKRDTVLTNQNFVGLFFAKSKKLNANLRNISDALFSNFSLSVTPYVSTNRLLSVNTVNKFSLNVLGGYSLGTDVLEIGGLFNIDKGNIKWIQIGGLFNLVGDSAKGVQIGGLMNVTGKQMLGVQIGGLLNVNMSDVKGVQIGGLTNLNLKNFNGVEISGLANISDTLRGFGLAGLTNFSSCSKNSVEIAGISNRSKYGEHNYQLSGLHNRTEKGTTNMQVSGFYNKAYALKGLQLGLFNYADSASGIPIGFISIVKNGYNKAELSSDELMVGSIAINTGVSKLYNIFIGGVQYNTFSLWTYGYGLGSDVQLSNKWSLCLNATSQQLQVPSNQPLKWNRLNKLYVGASFEVLPKLRINAGPTVNLLMADLSDENYTSTFSHLSHSHFYEYTDATYNLKMWLGAKIALKFF